MVISNCLIKKIIKNVIWIESGDRETFKEHVQNIVIRAQEIIKLGCIKRIWFCNFLEDIFWEESGGCLWIIVGEILSYLFKVRSEDEKVISLVTNSCIR